MAELSKSPDRDTFQKNCYIQRKEEEGIDNIEEYQKTLEYYDSIQIRKNERDQDPEWQKSSLEYDLRSTDWILEKVRSSDVYAQNLYAAMCNNEFQKLDVMPILKDQRWSCSWRYAGGIIADMRQEGDYIDWYCSGIGDAEGNVDGFQPESTVTVEIEQDLKKLGWLVFTDL